MAANGVTDMTSEVVRQVEQTLSPDATVRRAAEAFLQSHETAEGFVVTLLHVVASDAVPQHVRQAAAVYLKNVVRRRWEDVSATQRDSVKGVLVGVMMATPLAVRRQLSEVLAIIAEHEYPDRWDSLLPELVQKLGVAANGAGPNWTDACGVLETLHALFERYRYQFRSDALFLEIKYSLEKVHLPLLASFKTFSEIIFAGRVQPEAAGLACQVAELCCKIYYSLVWQDLPAQVEDHLSEWNADFLKYLLFTSNNPAVEGSPDDEEPSPLDRVHAAVIEAIDLFLSKYDEEIGPYLDGFVNAVWHLLTRRGVAPKYDGVATTGIKFLTTVAKSPYFEKFQSPETLQSICQNIVVPNVQLRSEDEELLEDNPMEYVRRDMEGSDTGTRRRSACELVNGLCSHYEQPVTAALTSYISTMLANFQSNPQAWKEKDCAIYLVTALGWRAGTLQGGATTTSQLVDVVDFFRNHVLAELQNGAARPMSLPAPVLVADAVKFVTTFRNQIPREHFATVLELCKSLLGSPVVVVHTYAALCIERFLTVKDTSPTGQKTLRYGKADVQSSLPGLLQACSVLLVPGRPENEYVMKMLTRLCSVAGDSVRPHLESLLQLLNQILEAVSTNPSNPTYNHYLFETIASLVRSLCSATSTSSLPTFESSLFPRFQYILANDVSEFGPYVFQILTQMMKAHPAGQPLSAPYQALLAPLLGVELWDRPGYVPGMVQYIQGFMRQSPDQLTPEQLNAILGIFQKLIASKANDQHGMTLLCTIVEQYGGTRVTPDIANVILRVLVFRLNAARTTKFVHLMLYFFSLFVMKLGSDALVAGLDATQPGLLLNLLTHVWIPEVVSIGSSRDRKVCSLGMTALVTSPRFQTEPFAAQWAPTLNATIALLEGIKVEAAPAGDEPDDDREIAAEYNVAYSQLAWGSTDRNRDPFPSIDPKIYLATKLDEFSATRPGTLQPLVQNKLEAQAQHVLAAYLSAAGKQLR